MNGNPKRLLFVHHTMTGGTRQMVEAALRGAATEPGVTVTSLRAAQATATGLLEADGYLFATPENLASMSGIMKDFFDRTYYDALGRLDGRPYAAMICAGSDGQGAARQLERIALGWRLQPIAPALVAITHAQTPAEIRRPKQIAAADLHRCEELGATLAAGIALGVF